MRKIIDYFPLASPAGGKSLRSGGAPAPLPKPPLCTGLSADDRINHYKPINYFSAGLPGRREIIKVISSINNNIKKRPA